MILDGVKLRKNLPVFCTYYGHGKILNIQGERAVVYFDSGLKQIYDKDGYGIGARNKSLHLFKPLLLPLDRNDRAHADIVNLIDVIYEKYVSIYGENNGM